MQVPEEQWKPRCHFESTSSDLIPAVILENKKVFIIPLVVSQTSVVNSLCGFTESSKEPSAEWKVTVHSTLSERLIIPISQLSMVPHTLPTSAISEHKLMAGKMQSWSEVREFRNYNPSYFLKTEKLQCYSKTKTA